MDPLHRGPRQGARGSRASGSGAESGPGNNSSILVKFVSDLLQAKPDQVVIPGGAQGRPGMTLDELIGAILPVDIPNRLCHHPCDCRKQSIIEYNKFLMHNPAFIFTRLVIAQQQSPQARPPSGHTSRPGPTIVAAHNQRRPQ